MVKKKSKKVSIRSIGVCRYCDELLDTSNNFVIFADKSAAHHECYRVDAEMQEQKNESK
ncbi:hypothetical protein [uncultured Mediterranean phage uvMED]|jgi:hypothetical protein|nr:hypothetical protein [uncultured Mediterranean phage uvMED]|tara:strand:+ start:1700 stop:1876 length:177 start_codon:yes stop_codon:yes gene_type:complete